MQSAIPVQERPARNVLTVEPNYANPTRKVVVRATRSSVRPVFYSIKRSTRKPPQRIVEKGESAEVRNASEQR